MTIYGFGEVDLEELRHPFAGLAKTPEEWRRVFSKSLQSVRIFLAIHDSLEVIAKCVNQARANATFQNDNPGWLKEKYDLSMLIGPAELKVLQALALMQVSSRKRIPASPGSIRRFLPEVLKCLFAFSRMQPSRYPDNPEREYLIYKIRMQTMLYRNSLRQGGLPDCHPVYLPIDRQAYD